MRNSKTTKDIYDALIKMPNLHSIPELDNEILTWKLYKNVYVQAYCDSYDTCIDIISISKGSLTHWHPDEDDMLEELYVLGKKGNILVIKKFLLGNGIFYKGEPEKYPFAKGKKWHWGKLTYIEQKSFKAE